MIRVTLLALSLLALPGVASATCGMTQGSFAVHCESGVKVYRHSAPSAIPVGPTAAQVQLNIAKMRHQAEQNRIIAQREAQAEQVELRERELALEDYRTRILDRDLRNQNRFFGVQPGLQNGLGFGAGVALSRPISTQTQN